MKKIILSGFVFLFFLMEVSLAQKVISGRSDAAYFELEAEYERGLPPNLFADLQFTDENGNGILEASERAELNLTLTNKGKGVAQGLQIRITEEYGEDRNLNIGKGQNIHYLSPGQSCKVNIPLEAGFDISSAEHKMKITVLEHFGYDMDPAYLVLNTLEYQAPKIAFSGFEVVDYGEGTGAIVEDGQIQAGELVKVKVFVQNIGQNIAENVRYEVISRDENVFVDEGSGLLDNIGTGEVKDFWITVSPNKRISTANLPLYLWVEVDKEKGSLNNYHLPLALNQRPPETEILQVQADIEKLREQVARFEYTSNKFTANVGKIENIREVPVSGTMRQNAVAVVFGIENYDELPPAPYAENDARIMKEYFSDMLGIDKVVVYTSKQARGLIFDDVFNPDYGELQRAVVKGETDLFIFYSGHGIPSKDGENIFLFPSDGKIARLDMQGYNINTLFNNLEKLGAKSINIFLDACFSGVSRRSEKIHTENLVSMKGIRIKPRIQQPWEYNHSFSVFSSSGYDETSLALDASQTGLFTYYVCTGLKGGADLDNNRQITMGELYRYVKKEVMNTSKKISGLQTPEFHGDASKVLVEF